MSLKFDEIRQVLMADGWHNVADGSYSEYDGSGEYYYFCFKERTEGGRSVIISGPIASLLAFQSVVKP